MFHRFHHPRFTRSTAHLAHSSHQAGFTLIELLTVIVMVGILAAIAVPSWLSFANGQRANTVRSEILQLLRQAQAEARRNRQIMMVDFDPAANPPTVSLLKLDSGAPDNPAFTRTLISTQQLGREQQIPPALLEDSLAVRNSVVLNDAALGVSNVCPTDNCVAFDATGAVMNLNTTYNTNSDDDGEPPAIFITVSIPADDGQERCVILETLLGAVRPDSGDACN